MTKNQKFVALALVVGALSLAGCTNPAGPSTNPTPTPSATPTFLPDPIVIDAPVPANISLDDVKALMASAMGRPTDTGARFSCREIVVELHGLEMTDLLAEGIRAWGLNPDAPNPACGTLNITVTDQVVAETGGPDFKPDRVTVSVGRVYIHPQSVRFGEYLMIHGTGHAAYGFGHSMNEADVSGSFIMFGGASSITRLFPNNTERWLADLIWRNNPGAKFNFHR